MTSIADYEPAINRLRRIQGWVETGEPNIPRLRGWIEHENITPPAFDELVTRYLKTNSVSLFNTRDHVGAIIKRFASIRSTQNKNGRVDNGCVECGDKVTSTSWAGRYCATHFRYVHVSDIDSGLSYPEGPRSERCDKCKERWSLLCLQGKFCGEHSEGVIAKCIEERAQ